MLVLVFVLASLVKTTRKSPPGGGGGGEWRVLPYIRSLQAGSSVENGARSKYKGLVTSLLTSYQALIFRPRAIFNGRACLQAIIYAI